MDPSTSTHLFDFATSNLVLFDVDAVEKISTGFLSEDIKIKKCLASPSTKIPASRRYILPKWTGTKPKTLPNRLDAKPKSVPNWVEPKSKTKIKNNDLFRTPLPFDEEIGDISDDEVLVINDFPTRESIDSFRCPSSDFKSPSIVFLPRRTYSKYEYHGIYVPKRMKKRELIIKSEFKLRPRRKPKFIFRIQMNSTWLRAAKVHNKEQSVTLQPRFAKPNAIHNLTERMRRIDQATALEKLRVLVPSLSKQIVQRPSKKQILDQAAELCKYLNSTESRLERKLSLLRKMNLELKWRLKSLSNPQFILPH